MAFDKALAAKPDMADVVGPGDRSDLRVVVSSGCCVAMVPCVADVTEPTSCSPDTFSSSMGTP